MRSPFDDDNADQQEQQPTYPDELRIDKPPDPSAFVRATLSPDRVYVGQQVTLKDADNDGDGLFSVQLGGASTSVTNTGLIYLH